MNFIINKKYKDYDYAYISLKIDCKNTGKIDDQCNPKDIEKLLLLKEFYK